MSEPMNLQHEQPRLASRYGRTFLMCAVIFLAALGVRLLHWQDNQQAFPFAGMTVEYKSHALVLLKGDLAHFLRGSNPPSDANVIKHPLGYPLFIAAVYKVFGTSDTALRAVHIILDALAALLVFFIAAELFPRPAAFIAGLLVAFSPQLAYHSIALLPDPLAAPFILLAFYFLIRAYKQPRLAFVIATGVCIGVSCWFRANAMLLAPFLACLIPFLFERGKRLRYAAALIGATFLIIAPHTIRNIVVFKSFVPLSLSAGITLIEGIGDYDREGRFGLPATDYGVTVWEAREYNRPDYIGTRFSPDGLERERRRIARGLTVARQHPFWFLGSMFYRASSMLRLARVEKVSTQIAVTHALDITNETRPARVISPRELSAQRDALLSRVEPTVVAGGQMLRVVSDDAGDLIVTPPINVQPGGDYLIRLPLRIEQGSVVIVVLDAQRNTVLSSTPILHPVNWLELKPEEQPAASIQRPFVSGEANQVRIVIRNNSQSPAHVEAEVGWMEMFELGTSSYTWTRYPRLVVRGVQSLFLTAFSLPLVIIGAVLLARARRWRALIVLFVVPAYYMCAQSALWTEFRYILTMHYFLFVLAAAALYWMGKTLWANVTKVRERWP